MTKPKKKLSARARRKEATGINIEAAKRRERQLELRIAIVENRLNALINILLDEVKEIEKKKGKKK